MRFKYIRGEYRHYIQDIEVDGEYKQGYRGSYGEFDLEELADLLNKQDKRIKDLTARCKRLEYLLCVKANEVFVE